MSVIEVDLKAFGPIHITGMPSIVSGITIEVVTTPSFKPVIITSPLISLYLKILFKFIPPFEFLPFSSYHMFIRLSSQPPNPRLKSRACGGWASLFRKEATPSFQRMPLLILFLVPVLIHILFGIFLCHVILFLHKRDSLFLSLS